MLNDLIATPTVIAADQELPAPVGNGQMWRVSQAGSGEPLSVVEVTPGQPLARNGLSLLITAQERETPGADG